MASHLGVHPSDHVVLQRAGDGTWERVLPNGLAASDPFEVPPGRYLVITDVDWCFSRTTNPLCQNVTLRIFVTPRNDLENGNSVFQSTTLLDQQAYGGVSQAMTSGFVVDDSATIVCDSIPFQDSISDIVLRGYLIDK
jgi:hypothetical protein